MLRPRIKFAAFVLTLIYVLLASTMCFADNVTVNKESGSAYRDALDLFKKSKYDQAAPLFEKAYNLDNRNLNALFAYGMSLSKLGKYAEAAEQFTLLLSKDNKHEKAHRMLPVALTNAGRTDDALASYDNAIKMFPDNYNFPFGKAVLLMKLGRNKDAIPFLVKASEIEPGRIEILEKLVFAYRETGDIDNGYKTARTILAKDPKHSWSLVMAGDYYRTNEEYQKALDAYKQASKSIDTKAYAEHYIDVINQTLEELDIEKEYQERMKKNQ